MAPNAARTISCNAWNSPAEYPSLVARCDIKRVRWHHVESDILKEGPGVKYPGRWEIAGRQIPSVKMLFKTNTKGHKHPSIRLFITEQDTIGKPKKTNVLSNLMISWRRYLLLFSECHHVEWCRKTKACDLWSETMYFQLFHFQRNLSSVKFQWKYAAHKSCNSL